MSASAQEIRAGKAFVELGIRDKTAQALARATTRMKVFAENVQMIKAGAGIAALGAAITALATKSAGVFMEVSKFAKDFGKTIAGADPAKAEKLTNAFNTLKAVLGAIQFFIGEALAGPMTTLLQIFIGGAAAVAKFIRANQGLVIGVAAAGAVLTVAGAALVGLGIAMASAGVAITGVVSLLGFLASPLGIVLGLLVGGAVAWFGFTEAGQNSMSGIAAAIANGDIAGAFSMVVQTMMTMWAQWSDFVIQTAGKAAHMVIDVWQSAVKSIAKFLNDSGVTEIHAEEEKAKKLREQQIHTNFKNIGTLQDMRERAIANGGTVQSGSQTVTVAQLDKTIADMQAQNETLIAAHQSGASPGVMEGAHASIDTQVGQMASGLHDAITSLEKVASDARDTSRTRVGWRKRAATRTTGTETKRHRRLCRGSWRAGWLW
jgi:hypothetical protein